MNSSVRFAEGHKLVPTTTTRPQHTPVSLQHTLTNLQHLGFIPRSTSFRTGAGIADNVDDSDSLTSTSSSTSDGASTRASEVGSVTSLLQDSEHDHHHHQHATPQEEAECNAAIQLLRDGEPLMQRIALAGVTRACKPTGPGLAAWAPSRSLRRSLTAALLRLAEGPLIVHTAATSTQAPSNAVLATVLASRACAAWSLSTTATPTATASDAAVLRLTRHAFAGESLPEEPLKFSQQVYAPWAVTALAPYLALQQHLGAAPPSHPVGAATASSSPLPSTPSAQLYNILLSPQARALRPWFTSGHPYDRSTLVGILTLLTHVEVLRALRMFVPCTCGGRRAVQHALARAMKLAVLLDGPLSASADASRDRALLASSPRGGGGGGGVPPNAAATNTPATAEALVLERDQAWLAALSVANVEVGLFLSKWYPLPPDTYLWHFPTHRLDLLRGYAARRRAAVMAAFAKSDDEAGRAVTVRS